MEELIKRLERIIQTGAPDKDGMHPISAETVLEVVRGLSEHGTNLASLGTDCISRQQAIDAIGEVHPLDYNSQAIKSMIKQLPPIHPEPHWIPVTEEPISDGEYLVTWTSEIQEKPILSIICRYSGVWDCWELQMLGHHDINVLAYMELPEPYKGVTE